MWISSGTAIWKLWYKPNQFLILPCSTDIWMEMFKFGNVPKIHHSCINLIFVEHIQTLSSSPSFNLYPLDLFEIIIIGKTKGWHSYEDKLQASLTVMKQWKLTLGHLLNVKKIVFFSFFFGLGGEFAITTEHEAMYINVQRNV